MRHQRELGLTLSRRQIGARSRSLINLCVVTYIVSLSLWVTQAALTPVFAQQQSPSEEAQVMMRSDRATLQSSAGPLKFTVIDVQRPGHLGWAPLVRQSRNLEHPWTARGEDIYVIANNNTLARLDRFPVELDVTTCTRIRRHRSGLEHSCGPQPLVDSNFFHLNSSPIPMPG